MYKFPGGTRVGIVKKQGYILTEKQRTGTVVGVVRDVYEVKVDNYSAGSLYFLEGSLVRIYNEEETR